MLLIAVMAYHFAIAIAATGPATGLGTAEFAAAYVADPWQAVASADLVACLLTICGWVFLRERSRATAAIWSAIILYWGDVAVSLYILWLIRAGGGRWDEILLGRLASPDLRRVPRVVLPHGVRAMLALLAVLIAGYALRACWTVAFAAAPVTGLLWGLGSIALGLGYMAYRGGTS